MFCVRSNVETSTSESSVLDMSQWPLWAVMPVILLVVAIERYQDWCRGEVRCMDLPLEKDQ